MLPWLPCFYAPPAPLLLCSPGSLESGEVVRTWRPHKSPVADLAVDASGGYLATASADRSVKVWDLAGGYCTHSFAGGHAGVVLTVRFHPKQHLLFSGGDDAEVRVWDLVEKRCVATFKVWWMADVWCGVEVWAFMKGSDWSTVVVWA
eukprot:356470-Chlamydomonas_euryale.AAC.4